jgi:hypothetical protein
MTYSSKVALWLVIASLAGCAKPIETEWLMRSECMEQRHRDKAAEIAKTFLAATPSTVSGDDQDWEDSINAAAARAQELACPTVLMEYRNGFTGRWKYVNQGDADTADSAANRGERG